MITILSGHVASNILVATLKLKVTAWPCSKNVSAHDFVIWNRNLQLFDRKDYIRQKTGAYDN